MKQNIIIKAFDELTVRELYGILQLRNKVFIVEQNSLYLDIDGKDEKSLHLLLYIGGEIAGYTRLLPAGISYNEVAIGRVVIAPFYRGMGLGKPLMEASIEGCYSALGKSPIRIGAQLHLLKFYQSLGFIEQGEPYDEDGILHIEMIKEC